jgi:hypothetical protein
MQRCALGASTWSFATAFPFEFPARARAKQGQDGTNAFTDKRETGRPEKHRGGGFGGGGGGEALGFRHGAAAMQTS